MEGRPGKCQHTLSAQQTPGSYWSWLPLLVHKESLGVEEELLKGHPLLLWSECLPPRAQGDGARRGAFGK